jgi:hypothetical protein
MGASIGFVFSLELIPHVRFRFIFLLVGEKSVPWYSTVMLALEANHCHSPSLSKLAFGGLEAHSEAKLMITESPVKNARFKLERVEGLP